MKPRDVNLDVTDHAVLRYLERQHGLDVEAVRRHVAGLAVNGAVLGAVGVAVDEVRLVLAEQPSVAGRRPYVVVVTALKRGWATQTDGPQSGRPVRPERG